MIKKLLNYELNLFLPYFIACLIFMLIIGFVSPLISSIPPLTNLNCFNLKYNSLNIFSYLNLIYKISMLIFIFILGLSIHLFIRKNIISPQGRNVSLLPFEKKTIFLIILSSISIWSFILLLAHIVVAFMGLSIFSLLNIEYQNLYSLFFASKIDGLYLLNMLTYFFLEETLILISIFSSFLSFTRHFKRFHIIFFILFFLIIILTSFGFIYLFLLPLKDIILKYVVLLLLCSSLIIIIAYLDFSLFNKKIEID